MSDRAHWNRVYGTKKPDTSLSLVAQAASRMSAIIDVGGGQSTLVDDLAAGGYTDLTVLDISSTALEATRARASRASGSNRPAR